MNKMTKLVLSSTLVFGSVLGVNAISTNAQHVSHAAITPYYTYHGYAGYNPSFLLTHEFKNGIKYKNITFNGKKIVPTKGTKTVKLYDQTFSGVTKSGKSASTVSFDVTGKLTTAQLKNAYGKALKKVGPPKPSKKVKAVYDYRPSLETPRGLFTVNHNNRVTHVDITYGSIGY